MDIITERRRGLVFYTLPEIPWQYPAITEKSAYECLYNFPGDIYAEFIALPWATIMDKSLYNLNVTGLNNSSGCAVRFTVCQHIRHRKLRPLFRNIGINVCFASHATIEDIEYFKESGIDLYPFPLFAVNTPNPDKEKDYIYSFIGMEYREDHISTVRDKIFKMKHPAGTCIIMRSGWHYDDRVYKEQVKNTPLSQDEINTETRNTIEFNEVLGRSRYSLCPSGTGPNTIRFWESLSTGSIPIVLSDKMLLPEYNWEQCILRIDERDIHSIPGLLQEINLQSEIAMRARCIEAYKQFSGNNFANTIRYHIRHINRSPVDSG